MWGLRLTRVRGVSTAPDWRRRRGYLDGRVRPGVPTHKTRAGEITRDVTGMCELH